MALYGTERLYRTKEDEENFRRDDRGENKETDREVNKETNRETDSVEEKKQKSPKTNQESGGNEEKLIEFGQASFDRQLCLMSIIGEIEGHECLPANAKTTKYEHILPQLAAVEENSEIRGLLILLNTVGGDVEAGLAIAEMIASISKPTVSLVLGGSHSFGVPIAVAADCSYIVPTGTMVIHPVRMSGTVIGAPQTYEYFRQMQERIIRFTASHSQAEASRLEQLMMNTGMMTKDLGTILVGEQAVKEGLIDEVGGISQALAHLRRLCGMKLS